MSNISNNQLNISLFHVNNSGSNNSSINPNFNSSLKKEANLQHYLAV